jgi:hypothetical protein
LAIVLGSSYSEAGAVGRYQGLAKRLDLMLHA